MKVLDHPAPFFLLGTCVHSAWYEPVIDIRHYANSDSSVAESRKLQLNLFRVLSKNTHVSLALQDQDWAMHTIVDLGHIESQMLPEVFVAIRHFHVR